MRIISGIARGTKLYSLDGMNTRPTLDRVKESLFNILQDKVKNAVILDLFSGSGALALESLSRGAKKGILCDKSPEAITIIKRNIEKTHFENKTKIICKDYRKCLEDINEKVDLIFIDPPYDLNIAVKALNIIIDKDILSENGIIVIETDDEKREIEQINKLNDKINIYDLRTYGRVKLIFLNREGKTWKFSHY